MNYFDIDVVINQNQTDKRALNKHLNKEQTNNEPLDEHLILLLNYLKNKEKREKFQKQIFRLLNKNVY